MIVRSILPELHRCLTKKTKSDEEHKLAQPTKYAEDEEVLRVPIALAMVKLLQNLPKGTLEHSLPSLLIKVCEFLRSRSKDIRNITRDTLVKIVDSLGPSFFHYVLKELRGALTKGYQLHVLSFTVHSLLKSMTAILRPGDLDNCVQSLTEVFSKELFGQVAEEKEVEGIVGKLFEARSSKSYDSYEILAKFISKSSLTSLIIPLKEVLDSTHSHKISKKVQEVLRRVTLGLIENKELKEETLLIFIHGLANEALPLITPDQKDKSNTSKPPPDPRLHPPSTFLLTSAPPRGGIKPSGNQKTNMHILVDFGLQLLYMLLKRSRVVASNTQNLQMLDPFIEILSNCLSSKHVKIVTTSLRCLSWMLKFPLPSLKDHITKITNQLFVLLKNYATAGGAQGENFELVVSCFKTITVLVRDVKFHSVDTNQLQILLGYVEEDMHDFNRQATAFGLLKAILSRKLLVPEIHEIIGKVAQLSITADAPNVRLQSRQVVLQFMLDYPLGKQLKKHLEFYVTNLQFELESGRESALEMLATIFSSFPQNILTEHAGFFFVPMAASLVNDESAQCRKLTALAIKSLLSKLHSDQRDELLNITMLWFQDEKVSHRRLAAQLCGLFTEVESAKFERHMPTVLPLILQQIEPGRYQGNEPQSLKELDHLLFNSLTALGKLLKEINIIRNPRWTEDMNAMWVSIQSHLLHPHTWVRLATARLFGLLFAAWTPEEIAQSEGVRKPKAKPGKVEEYVQQDTRQKLRELSIAFCTQLQSSYVDQELADQVVKNLVFLAQVIKLLNPPLKEKHRTVVDNSDEKPTDLKWLIRKMCREAKFEAAQNQKSSLKVCYDKWQQLVSHRRLAAQLCGLFTEVESAKFERHMPSVLPLILQQIEPGRYQGNKPQSLKELDHLLFNSLTALGKLLKEINIIRNPRWTEDMNAMWVSIQSHLLHPHTWVRLAAARLFGLLFAAWTPEEIVQSEGVRKPKAKPGKVEEYVQQDTRQKLRELSIAFCTQLQSSYVDQELADQVVKNLVFLAQVIKLLNPPLKEKHRTVVDNSDEKPTDLKWLIRKMCREAKFEAAQNQKSSLKRSSVLRWLAAVAVNLGRSDLPDYIEQMLPPIYAASVDSSLQADPALKSLALEILELMKNTVGVDVFTRAYSTLHKTTSERKEARKRQKAQEAVSNPEVAAKRKIKKHVAKKEAKKRKIQEFRPSKQVKKKKLQDMAVME
ncbi:small subunit processome component 20 homolog [Lingula anatina]|uniref:Small subunit processome component 20 homolog n=1 Tax=Lingula anatina TaxID=7574 RepID=A0A1S3HP70_LINAN|nr:small subunit processome component 20 homolog [Lingula anatina]|eukprot:XP_013387842.1 small subunit processome component 20 homolog [Lingula anatina]